MGCHGDMHTEPEHTATIPPLGHYAISPSKSAVTFRTRHLFGLAPVRGRFAVRAGTVDVAEPIAASSVYAEVETASFRTPNPQRNRSVLSARFLDSGRYPVMTFTAERIDWERGELAGTLTVREASRPVSFRVSEFTAANGQFGARATARVDRTEFGITAARGLAARYLDMAVEVTCVRS
jgi:polyisoprenoid-binding protein YceI